MSEHEPPEAQRPEEYDQTRIPEPVIAAPGYVTNTFTFPDGTTPDHERNLATAVTLQARFDPRTGPKTRLGLVESGLQFTTHSHEWDGVSMQQVRRRRAVPGEYKVGRKLSAAVVLGSAALFNLVGNIPSIAGVVDRIVYDVQSHSHEAHQKVPVVIPGKPKHTVETVTSGSPAGQVTINQAVVSKFVHTLHSDVLHGGTISSIGVVGLASDEDARYPHSIGQPTASNQALARERAQTGVNDLKAAGVPFPADKITQSAREKIITDKALIKALEAEAQKDGYPDLLSAIEHANAGDTLNPNLAKAIYDNFTGPNNRGATFTAGITYPGQSIIHYRSETIRVGDGTTPPHIPRPEFYGFIPLPPIRKRETYEESVPQLTRVAHAHDIYLPKLVREKADKKFLQIYDDGVGDDNLPKADALWHTEKFEYLLREDDRLQDMLRLDLVDAGGQPQTIRALFVDAKPADAERTIFQDELVRAALLCEGKLAEVIQTIVVYPASSAGTEHQDPSRIGLGQLHQLSSNILGAYNPVLKLLELVAPDDWASEDLQQLFQSFNGPKAVMWHEIGHAIKRKGETYLAREAKLRSGERTYVLDVADRNTEMEAIVEELKPLQSDDPYLAFDVSYTVKDENGEEALVEDRVLVGSKQLGHAEQARIVGSHVLPRPRSLLRRHANARRRLADEEYADSLAGLATRGIPLITSGIHVAKTVLKTGNSGKFNRWFLPTKPVQSLIERQAAAQPGVVPLTPVYASDVTVTHVEPRKDPLIGGQMTRARQAHSRDGRQLVTYLTEVNYAERAAGGTEAGNG